MFCCCCWNVSLQRQAHMHTPCMRLPGSTIACHSCIHMRRATPMVPADADDARRVLQMLSGQRHHVHTGVALVMPQSLEGVGSWGGSLGFTLAASQTCVLPAAL